jgi:hypothetical protein
MEQQRSGTGCATDTITLLDANNKRKHFKVVSNHKPEEMIMVMTEKVEKVGIGKTAKSSQSQLVTFMDIELDDQQNLGSSIAFKNSPSTLRQATIRQSRNLET